MGIEGLDKIFNPRRIAVIGASNRENSVGYKIFNNIIGFRGFVYPVNPFSQSVQGITAYPSIRKIPWHVDLAVIATPAHIVPEAVEECGEAGVTGVIIVSSGFREIGQRGRALEEDLLKIKSRFGLRIIGPNSLGVIRPGIRLNTTFAKRMVKPGNIAFISQSGAICASVLDWAEAANIGFSAVVSLGNMIDVDFADLIDYFGMDPETRSIMLFIEFINDPGKFMSAARRFAAIKPIIAIKAGRTSEGMRAAFSHIGAIASDDALYDALFSRAGVVRVETISDLFSCSEILAMQPLPKSPDLVIITNAGGAGIMAADALTLRGGRVARLSEKTIEELNKVLPYYWSGSNPVDICEDATVERFRKTAEICMKDPNAGGFLILYTPIGEADPIETAKAVVEVFKGSRKPVLTCWLGEKEVHEAREIFRRNKIPTYPTPEEAIAAFMYMYQYAKNIELLYEVPEEIKLCPPSDRAHLKNIIERAVDEGRLILTEFESKEFLKEYGIPVSETYVARSVDEAAEIASRIGFPVVMKVLSPDITHKMDAGGVILNIYDEAQVKNCFLQIIENVKSRYPNAKICGVTVQPMYHSEYEVIIGSRRDLVFGSFIVFGSGGANAEVFRDIAIGFPPLNQILARRMIERTKVHDIFSMGFKGLSPSHLRPIEEVLVRFSQLVIDFPEIDEMEINPLAVSCGGVVALDARIIVNMEKVKGAPKPYEHLIIRPYPAKYICERALRDGSKVILRPARPEDEPLIIELFKTFSTETLRSRFFRTVKEIDHYLAAKYCNIDYSREVTIVAETETDGKKRLIGMAELIVQPDGCSSEISVVVGDPWQNKGLGSIMIDHLIEIGKDMGQKRLFGEFLAENKKIFYILQKRGFEIKKINEETCIAVLNL
ncbi:MAG: bifunctional acetate--CoA ligase family protein/GNAT family N-acetyltransferase [Candidatus Bathyarchaeia archaeon]|nr:bifunctional acetate--CoA ligase family protein/GNAT family N-acetyltransferase [Candidatus Bathyarchaeota archaeon]